MPEWLDIATFLLLQAMNLAFIAHAMVVALSGRAGDLIEERRRFRVFFVAAVGLYMGVVVAAELVLRGGPPTPFLSLLNSVGILLLSFVAFVRSAALRPDRLLGALVASEPRPNPATPVNARIEISESDKRILAELARAMEALRTKKGEEQELIALQ
jgi:hypothetical protein